MVLSMHFNGMSMFSVELVAAINVLRAQFIIKRAATMTKLRGFLGVLREYCLNSTIGGLSYIADSRYHYTERLFWLVCLLFGTFGTYHFIIDTVKSFESDTISMVVESLQPLDKTHFPSLAVCEMGYTKEEYDFLEDFAENATLNSEDDENNGDIYDFLMRIVFFNLYATNTLQAYCTKYENNPNLVECPKDNYIDFSKRTSAKCEDFMLECRWMDKPFDCCTYFRPLRSTYGPCFFLNNIQATEENGRYWLDTSMDVSTGPGRIMMAFSKSARICVLNKEQVPNLLFSRLHFELRNRDTDFHLALSLQSVINDASVRTVDPVERKCKFPDEDPQSRHKYYSFVTCIAECIKQAQLRACGCAHHYMTVNEEETTKKCDYEGLLCLDSLELIFPRANVLQPWNGFFGDRCNCYPSCTDDEMQIVSTWSGKSKTRQFTMRMINLPTQRYRRQRNKDAVDFVVAIGGIVGLFLGASILSLVEFIYFFSVRLLGSAWMRRNQRLQPKI